MLNKIIILPCSIASSSFLKTSSIKSTDLNKYRVSKFIGWLNYVHIRNLDHNRVKILIFSHISPNNNLFDSKSVKF